MIIPFMLMGNCGNFAAESRQNSRKSMTFLVALGAKNGQGRQSIKPSLIRAHPCLSVVEFLGVRLAAPGILPLRGDFPVRRPAKARFPHY
jgi:hypothetical protein